MDYILTMIQYGLILIFGVVISASFLEVQFNRRNSIALFIFSALSILIQIFFYKTIGYNLTESIYPVIIHLPLILFLALFFHRGALQSTIAVMSAYLCCQLCKWLGVVADSIIEEVWIVQLIKIIASIVIALLLIKYASPQIKVIFSKPAKSLIAISTLPITYYIFDYVTTVYTDLLYQSDKTVLEFLPFMFCVAYIIFTSVYFKEYESKCEAERYNQLMRMKQSQSKKEIDAIKSSEYAISILRHDMRHFLSNISLAIENGDNEKAQKYINEIIEISTKTTPHKYCSNNIINMIISSYESDMNAYGIDFHHAIDVPSQLPLSDVDITSILSNGLENAIHAVTSIEQEKRYIHLNLTMNENKLLLSIENPYAGTIEMIDGLPQPHEANHGLGTQSIRYVVEKLKGNCQFTTHNNIFTLRVIV